MKKLLIILFTFLIAQGIYSQGNNLQFNQVVNQDFNTSGVVYQWNNAGTFTVGANKVLKITSVSAFMKSSAGSNSFPCDMKIGEKLVYNSRGNGQADGNSIQTPIWFGSGSYTVYLFRHSATNADNQHGSISGVEFNIVQ